MLEYQNPDSQQTLAEGLQEYYGSHEGLVTGRGLSERAREFFRCHDAAHVIFGCSVTLPNEAMVKVWSFFGTDAAKFRLFLDYGRGQSREIYLKVRLRDILVTAVLSFMIVPRVLFRSFRMKKRWPWSDFEEYMTTPLATLRKDFGIRTLLVAM